MGSLYGCNTGCPQCGHKKLNELYDSKKGRIGIEKLSLVKIKKYGNKKSRLWLDRTVTDQKLWKQEG